MAAVIKRAVPNARLKSRIISSRMFRLLFSLGEPILYSFFIEAPPASYPETRYFSAPGEPIDRQAMHLKISG
jgi:hypothetical protein